MSTTNKTTLDDTFIIKSLTDEIDELRISPFETTMTTLSSPAIDTINTIDLSNISITGSPSYTISSGASTNTVWTSSGTGTSYSWPVGGMPSTQISQSGKVSLRGEDADVDINGKSLKSWMEKVEERLNILTPNPELEKEWDDLRKLGDRYRKLEKKCKEKAEVWKKLKAMPPQKLD